jgi:hypothetical protein
MLRCRATIFANATPVEVRQVVAGADQNRQSVVVAAKISRVVEVVLNTLHTSPTTSLSDAIKDAIMKTGFRRPDNQKQMSSEWNGIVFWAIHCEDIAVQALKTLEAAGLAATTGSLRSFRKLMTPTWRHKLAEKVLGSGLRTQQQLESVITALRHEQLVQFHWRIGNPNIEQDKGVRLCRASACFSVPLDEVVCA